MGEDFAGCVAGSVLVVGEGTAGCSEALGALSTGLSLKGTSQDGLCLPPGFSSSTPMSAASFSFFFSLPSGPPTESALKAAPKPSRENIEKCIGSRSRSAPQLVEKLVLKSNQLGGQGSTQQPTFHAWFYRLKRLVTPFWLGQY